MIVGFGPKPEKGSLPVFSVSDELEAKELIVLACPTNFRGEYYAPELAREQTIENLWAFGARLQRLHDEVIVPAGRCRCKGEEP